MFSAAGWQVLEAKYGSRLTRAFDGPGGGALRQRIDDMPNEEYQTLIRMPGATARERLLAGIPRKERDALVRALGPTSDEELPALLADLGGPPVHSLLRV